MPIAAPVTAAVGTVAVDPAVGAAVDAATVDHGSVRLRHRTRLDGATRTDAVPPGRHAYPGRGGALRGRGLVGTVAEAALVFGHQFGVLAREPGEIPLSRAGAQVQRKRRHTRGAGSGDRANRRVDGLVGVGEPRQ